jgi:hypothetical protein
MYIVATHRWGYGNEVDIFFGSSSQIDSGGSERGAWVGLTASIV